MSGRAIFTHQIDELTKQEDPLESIFNTIVFSSADFGAERDRAWLYGIVVGWDDEDDPDAEDVMSELAAQHRWSAEQVARLRRLHAAFVALSVHSSEVTP